MLTLSCPVCGSRFPTSLAFTFRFLTQADLHFQFYLLLVISPVILCLERLPSINTILSTFHVEFFDSSGGLLVGFFFKGHPNFPSIFTEVRAPSPALFSTSIKASMRVRLVGGGSFADPQVKLASSCPASEHPYLWSPVTGLGTPRGQGLMALCTCVPPGLSSSSQHLSRAGRPDSIFPLHK